MLDETFLFLSLVLISTFYFLEVPSGGIAGWQGTQYETIGGRLDRESPGIILRKWRFWYPWRNMRKYKKRE